MHNIGLRIKEERVRLGLKQAEVAKFGDVSTRTFSYYESGERVPDGVFLANLMPRGFDAVYILTGRKHDAPIMEQLKPDEVDVIDSYRLMGVERKKTARSLLLALANENMKKSGQYKIKKPTDQSYTEVVEGSVRVVK